MEWLVEIHSIWRWAVLLTAVAGLVLAAMSAFGSRRWDVLSDRSTLLFTIAMDIQLLIGIIVWLVQNRWSGDTMLGYVHPLLMVAAVALAHVGRSRSGGNLSSGDKGRQVLLFFGASLVLILIAIPFNSWPV